MTLRKDHGVQATKLEEKRKGIFDKYLAVDPKRKAKLVFAIDPKRYPSFKCQPYYSITQEPLQGDLHARLPWSEQWAWEVDVRRAVCDYKSPQQCTVIGKRKRNERLRRESERNGR
jgi:hypothetical protein